ncbi:MAG: AAA family ATPase [Deltaproteobacteria bacterium]|nr:AAA family ATPase [Deltaproteobacteria bacterium]
MSGSPPEPNPGALRKRVWRLMELAGEELYLGRPDLEIKGQKFNAALLLGVLTALFQGRELIMGEPGLGKTTSAEYLAALFYSLPLELVWQAGIAGHPEQTEEKIVGRPDLAALQAGREQVVWSYFALLPAKIVDELNRLPETKQSLILDAVDRGKWEYLNQAVYNPEFCLFATANYQDRGSNSILLPLLDRFDVMVESKHPGPNLACQVGRTGVTAAALKGEDLAQELRAFFQAGPRAAERSRGLEKICGRFAARVQAAIGLATFTAADRAAARREKEAVPLDLDANAFLRLLIAELSFCLQFGQKRIQETCVEGCHFAGYLCHELVNCISNRFPQSIRNYAQGLAWLMGDPQVELAHLLALAPYTLAHRLEWKEGFVARGEREARRDPAPLHLARLATERLHQSYVEQAHRIREALTVAHRIWEGEDLTPLEGDHPLFHEIRRDLGREGED